ncbi:MAG: UDP-glucose/GDP-mannose dehydrogenase family protein [Bacteroidota bacterium]|nr:UDP-glucose/GDP-mannose dehydrogenase family protein [Bacteroidota bacterium]
MKIAIVGTGYVGLVTGTCFAETGLTVTCVDIDQNKVEKLNNGIIPIYEPGLEQIVIKNKEIGRLSFTSNLKESLVDTDVVFIAVGTPPDEDGSADLSYVLGVAKEIGQHIDHYMVIVNKSTVPIGTAQKVKSVIEAEIEKRNVSVSFDVASNPEFLKEGNAIEDFLKPDRIVVGVESEKSRKIMDRLYKPFLINGHPLFFMDIASAEMTKYAANAMLATKISFMNDIANLCELVGADVNSVRKGIGSDPRIGHKFIYPGIGYGGSCFPKDVKALIKIGKENNYTLNILNAVETVNDNQKTVLFQKIVNHFGSNLEGKRFAIWGLSFKPKTDDMREAPSLVLIDNLLKAKAIVKAYDPVAMHEADRILDGSVSFARDAYDALLDVDALIIATEWPEFRLPNYKVMERLMKNKLIFDGRNIFEPSEMDEMGYTYYSIGRQTIKQY